MKIKIRATVIYEWMEDSTNWDDPKSEDELTSAVQEYIRGDLSYITEQNPTFITVERV